MANMTVRTAGKATARTAQIQNSDPPRKMSVMGVGGKIGISTLLYIGVAELVSWLFHPLFRITDNYGSLLIAGIMMAAVGFSLNLVAAFSMLKAHKEERLHRRPLSHFPRSHVRAADINHVAGPVPALQFLARARQHHSRLHLIPRIRAGGAQIS